VFDTESALAERVRRAGDPDRPAYHFQPPANWMNDPNGLIEWDGQTHLYYQYNPDGGYWGNIHWGHAVSDDLIHWTDLPIALTPSPGGPDETGCFSGCAVVDDGVPTIVYTGVRGERHDVQTQCLATSHDGLKTLQKYAGNPVLSEIPAEAGPTSDFRDPFVWRDGDGWSMVLASRVVGTGGVVFRYASPDLRHWEYRGPLLVGTAGKDGDVWECPNFFPLDGKWVLTVSGKGREVTPQVFYFTGEYADGVFTPETRGVVDDVYYYAPLTMLDRGGRRLMWGWIREGRTVEAQKAAGWAGLQAIPRQLRLRDGVLYAEPIAELQKLRGEPATLTELELSNEEIVLAERGRTLDIEVTLEPAGPIGLAVACAPDGSEQTRITYLPHQQQLVVDREQSSLLPDVDTFPHRVHHELLAGEALQLRLLLDGSVLEILANGRTAISTRIYPSRADSLGVRVFGEGKVKAMAIWAMRSIWA
jgi:beta-fructofuranosidase